jgi:LysM repeat protein
MTEEDRKKYLVMRTGILAKDICKIYWIPATLGLSSVGLIWGGRTILRKELSAMTAAYAALSESFNRYRQRVIQEYGADKDQEFQYGYKMEDRVDAETGEVSKHPVIDKEANLSEYGFWFDGDGVISFDQDATLYHQGSVTDFTLKAGEFYNVEGFGEHYLKLDDGNMLLLLEKAAPGNFANLPGDQPFSAFPGAIAAGSAEEAEPEPAPVEPEPAPAPAGQTYTVQAGDTLWSIAKRFYGSGFKWDVIYNANYDVIKNPRMIYVGQVLLIP